LPQKFYLLPVAVAVVLVAAAVAVQVVMSTLLPLHYYEGQRIPLQSAQVAQVAQVGDLTAAQMVKTLQ
jgi:hypothetical protein